MATLADLTITELESAILDAELEARSRYGEPICIQATQRRIPGTDESAIEFAASSSKGCFEHTMKLQEPYFTKRHRFDQYLAGLLSMLCRQVMAFPET